MQLPDYDTYYRAFKRKKKGKELFAIGTAGFSGIFWFIYVLLPFIKTFNGTLYEHYTMDGKEYENPTFKGVMVFLWYTPIGIGMVIAIFGLTLGWLCLREVKKEANSTWLATIIGLRQFEKKDYRFFQGSIAILLTSMMIPLFAQIPNEINVNMRVLLLYFITFLTLSTYGLLDPWVARRWERAKRKVEKKEEKKKALEKKKEEKNKQANSTQPSTISLHAVMQEALTLPEYQLPHFQTQIANILENIRTYDTLTEKPPIEDVHMMKRMVTEEIPAVLHAYEALDANNKKELAPAFITCLEKMESQIAHRNEDKHNIKKLSAEKILDIIQTRY